MESLYRGIHFVVHICGLTIMENNNYRLITLYDGMFKNVLIRIMEIENLFAGESAE